MQRYRRDEYENLDEYETDEEEEQEEEEEREEGPVLTREELEYLQLRQRIKESIRRKNKKENGSALKNAQQNNKSLPHDNYGSFFGPSKPVISQRVIQESKSILENQHLVSRNSNASGSTKNSSAPKTAVAKSGVRVNPPKVMNEVKAQKRQDTRDYSFLLSDDAELPAPTREPPAKRVHPPKPEVRSSQVGQKSKQISSSNGRQIENGREERRPTSMNGNGNMQRKPMPMVSGSKSNMTPSNSQKQFGSNSAKGPGRPVVAKNLPPKMPVTSTVKKISAPTSKYQPPPTKNPLPGLNRSLPSKNLTTLPKQPVQPRREYQEPSRSKLVQKQPLTSSKPQMNRPVKQVLSRPSLQEHRPKKKPARGYSDEEGDISSMIRNMFGYNPNDYDDDDIDNMEARFDDIQQEEERSERIARKEDEEELRKIEEEERRARERKRKMSHR